MAVESPGESRMINILIPLGGTSPFFEPTHYPFPKPLIEVGRKPMIQVVIDQFASIKDPHRFIFVLAKEDCQKFYLDDTLKLLANGNCVIIKKPNETQGAACTSLLAIDHINNDDELIISNGDQFLEADFNALLKKFRHSGASAAVPTFSSVHPKWSYIRVNPRGEVVETAEKRPISNRAIAGMYWFKTGKDFVACATQMIAKDAHVNGAFYIAPSMNELILAGKKLIHVPIDPGNYYSFYSPQKIEEFEAAHHKRKTSA
jgi:dTDP-glucose pyrophosphorylase